MTHPPANASNPIPRLVAWIVLGAFIASAMGCSPGARESNVNRETPVISEQVDRTAVAEAGAPTTWPTVLGRRQWEWRREATREPAILVIYRRHAWGGRIFQPDLIAAAWPDGEVIWSADPVLGGPPYCRGTVAPTRMRALIDRLTDLAARSGVGAGSVHTGPDASYNIFYFRTDGGRIFSVGSWGDPYPVDEATARDEDAWDRAAGAWRDMKRVPDWGDVGYGSIVRLWGALRGEFHDLLPAERQPAGQYRHHVRPRPWRMNPERSVRIGAVERSLSGN